jgi:hypothetical protein
LWLPTKSSLVSSNRSPGTGAKLADWGTGCPLGPTKLNVSPFSKKWNVVVLALAGAAVNTMLDTKAANARGEHPARRAAGAGRLTASAPMPAL